jgi:hypothetical protein
MTEPATPPALRLGRGLRILKIQMVQSTGETDDYDFTHAAMTVLTGPRNSSKTTTLKVIDYCLGDRDSVAQALGAAIEEKYVALSLDIAIDGSHHRLSREFSFGRRGKIRVDEGIDLAPPELSNWLLQQLGWPVMSIPLGRNPSTATQQTPLSFRACLRHMYRREDSWTEFAYKEEEFLRRAVVSLFLGFAPSRYETAEYEFGRAQRQLAAAEAVYRDVLASTEEAVQAFVTQLALPPIVDIDSLESVQNELQQHVIGLQAERNALADAATGTTAQRSNQAPGLDPALPHELERAASDAAAAAELVASLERVLEEHQRSRFLILADIARLSRLLDASEVFDEVPVTVCPACEQAIDPERSHDHAVCYLCGQAVSEDVRKRRAEREERALKAELDDLAEAIVRVEGDLHKARDAEAVASSQRTRLASELHDARVSQLAPFMAALEDIAAQVGRIEQQLAAIPALHTILARRDAANESVLATRSEVDRLSHLAEADERRSSDATTRCATLADRMNEFLAGFQSPGWTEGPVTISADDLTFYVGTRPWNEKLGAEARVLFFLAYSYGLLHIDRDLSDRACPPGMLLLDNPYQQGLNPGVVVDGVQRIANAASVNGAQVIVTQPYNGHVITTPHSEIHMPHEYSS